MAHIPGKPVRGRISPGDVIVAAFFIALGMATIIAVQAERNMTIPQMPLIAMLLMALPMLSIEAAS